MTNRAEYETANISVFDWTNVYQDVNDFHRRIDALEAKVQALESQKPSITPEQVAADWQAGHDQDFPAVFEAEERARAKQYANEHGLALTLEYISRLERIALASVALLKFDMVYLMRNPSEGEKQKELYEALRTVKLFEDEGL